MHFLATSDRSEFHWVADFSRGLKCNAENIEMMTADRAEGYSVIAKMRYAIVAKLRKLKAFSPQEAVTPEEAGFSLKEEVWLLYLAGGSLSSMIKKTKDGRYYL